MNRQLKKKIWICGDVWMDIFPFFDRPQLGLKMALLSDRFDVLVDAHFDGKSELTIWRPIEISKDEGPEPTLSVWIDGKWCYIDHSVIEFIRSNKQIWDRMGTKLELSIDGDETEDVQRIWDILARQIWPIFATNIRHSFYSLCAVTLLLASCGSILWFFSDHVKSLRRLRKKIFISADCWLSVFDFLSPSQLGLEIALISPRFDLYVDEHFKTRKWALTNKMVIQWDIEENGMKKMQIVNSDGKPLPIPQEPLPNKVIGFSGYIRIMYIDQNVLIFLSHFHHSFAATYTVDLDIISEDIRILEFLLLNIWPMFRDSICAIDLNSITFRRMCQLSSSMLTDCTALRYVVSDYAIFPEFLLPDGNANATDGETVTKWLFTPRPDGGPKWLQCLVNSSVEQWTTNMEQLRTAFSNASSPITFRIFLTPSSTLIDSVVPFDLINEVTGEQLVLEKDDTIVWLTRCPIGWVWQNWENEWKELCAARPRRINIWIRDGGFDEGLLDAASPGPSNQQQ